jgi:hypothetical protein
MIVKAEQDKNTIRKINMHESELMVLLGVAEVCLIRRVYS